MTNQGIDEEQRFVATLLARGYCTRLDIDAARKRLAALARRGDHRRLWDLLIEEGRLTPGQAEAVFATLGKAYRFCPRCNQRHRVTSGQRAQRIQCGRCGHGFDVRGESPRSGRTMMPMVTAKVVASEAPQVDLDLLSEIDQYRITGTLSDGAAGRVFRAVQTFTGRPVALKVLRPGVGPAGERARARFVEQVRQAARLEHDHILRVYDAGEFKGLLYLVTELVDGPDLGLVWTQQGVQSPRFCAQLLSQLSQALAFAAAHGMVHGAIRPHTVLRDSVGRLKLADFGLPRTGSEDLDLLQVGGQPVESFAFQSPEQLAERGGVDGRSDLFSLGVTAYLLVTGELPFVGASPRDLLWSMMNEPPAPAHKLLRDIPRGLSKLLARLLVVDPAGRDPDAAKLQADAHKLLGKLSR